MKLLLYLKTLNHNTLTGEKRGHVYSDPIVTRRFVDLFSEVSSVNRSRKKGPSVSNSNVSDSKKREGPGKDTCIGYNSD